jgi:hypothetical protein
MTEETKKLLELKIYSVQIKNFINDKIYHIIDFSSSFGTKCGYPLNQFMKLYYDNPPEGYILCKECEEGKIDWTKKL